MTTIALGPARAATGVASRAAARRPATRLRLTARGRSVLTALAALPAVLVVIAVIWGGGAALASRDAAAPGGTFETVTVSAGDSLWSIAQEIAPNADPRDVVADISRLNGLTGSVVNAGQRLAIPAEYGQ